jgi:hypothetical protein
VDRHLQRDLENLKNQEENFKQLTERAQQLATQVLSAALLSQKNVWCHFHALVSCLQHS